MSVNYLSVIFMCLCMQLSGLPEAEAGFVEGLKHRKSERQQEQIQKYEERQTYENPGNIDLAGYQEVLARLERSSEVWDLILDLEPKINILNMYISEYEKEGAVIRKPSQHYAQLIDQMADDSPGWFNQPFRDLLRVIAIMEYDYDIGKDRDALAREVLGDSLYEWNKNRLRR